MSNIDELEEDYREYKAKTTEAWKIINAEWQAEKQARVDLEKRVIAFGGQLQAWNQDAAAQELFKEVLGGTVVAPDYYGLQAQNADLEERVVELERERDQWRDAIARGVTALMPAVPHHKGDAPKTFDAMCAAVADRMAALEKIIDEYGLGMEV